MSNGKTRFGGRWVRDDTWLPWRYDSYQEWDPGDHPEVIVCIRRNWGFVRADVEVAGPDHPVQIVHPGQNIHGRRIASYTWSHHTPPPQSDTEAKRQSAWEQTCLRTAVVERATP